MATEVLTAEAIHKLERNLKVLFWQRFFYSALFSVPIIILFYQEKGFTLTDFFLLQPIFSIIVITFEIPVSYLSDKLGRKYILLLGTIFSILAAYSLWQAETLLALGVNHVIAGLACTLINASYNHILFDTLLALGREHEHKKYLGSLNATLQYVAAFAAISSGFLFYWYVEAPVIATLIFSCIAFIITLFIYEPPRTKHKKANNPIKDMLHIVKYSLHGHSELKWIILFSAIISVSQLKAFWLIQPLFQNMGISVILIGIFSAFCRTLIGISSQFVHHIEHKVSMKHIFIGIVLLATSTFMLSGLNIGYWFVIPLSFVFMASGASVILNHDLIHQRVSSDIRATVMSVESIIKRIMFAIITPVFGWLLGAISLHYAMTVIGIFIFILASLSFIMLKSKKVI